MQAQKERIEEKLEEKRAEQKENLTKVTASSLDEFIKKLENVLYETKADNLVTEQEKWWDRVLIFRFNCLAMQEI